LRLVIYLFLLNNYFLLCLLLFLLLGKSRFVFKKLQLKVVEQLFRRWHHLEFIDKVQRLRCINDVRL
jgi:hypothetical protein